MPDWIDEQIAYARRDDLQRYERQLALGRSVATARGRRPRFYGPLLARLGRHLAAWGAGLEARYSPPAEPPIAIDPCGGAA
ncbi:hypothetical protein [Kouleothrix sp.]|uniref:hypothetical protein n=1 Tax=Kouleothrix sp. TaxID=2779161 RepID=UPI0039193763